MTKRSRQSEAWGIASRADPFSRARVRLTLFYLAVLLVVVAMLSVVVYFVATQAVRQPGHPHLEWLEGPGRSEAHEESLTDYTEDVLRGLLLGDVVTMAVAGVLSYLLAGMTLRPIRDNVAARERFFAQAAHDLRTPLAVMRTEAEVALQRGELSRAEAARLVASQVEEIGRLSLLVERLLDVIRGSRPDPAREEALEAAPLARSVVERLSGLAQRCGVRLDFAARCTDTVRGVRLDLERAIANVVENAITYTPAGGTVQVSVLRTGRCVHIITSDTGIGIAAADLPHIGEPFYRGKAARAANQGGTGLGLAIVVQIVRSHGGTMRTTSRDGHGTTVDLRLPAA